MAFNAHELAGSQVGDEEHVLADELPGFIVFGDAAHDSALLSAAVIDGELEQLVGFFHFLAVQDVAHADIQFLEILKGNVLLDGLGFVGLFLVLPFGLGQLLQLSLYGLVLYLLEQQFRFGQLVPRLKQVCAAQLLPLKGGHVDELAQLGR